MKIGQFFRKDGTEEKGMLSKKINKLYFITKKRYYESIATQHMNCGMLTFSYKLYKDQYKSVAYMSKFVRAEKRLDYLIRKT